MYFTPNYRKRFRHIIPHVPARLRGLLRFAAVAACLIGLSFRTGLAQVPQPPRPQVPGLQRPAIPAAPQPATLQPGPLYPGHNTHPGTRQDQSRPMLQPTQPRTALPATATPDPFAFGKSATRAAELEAVLRELREADERTDYALPDRSGVPGTDRYRAALAELKAMTGGALACDLKRAVWLVESAWYGGAPDYRRFCSQIDRLKAGCAYLIDQLPRRNNYTENLAIFGFLTDTTRISVPGGIPTPLPLRYDFEDFRGRKDWSKMFVTKLLETGTGQCHSMPLLYLILAEELGVKARLAYGPEHIYIKFPDEDGTLRNAELTNGRLTTDAFVTASGYVSAAAVRSGIYLDTLSRRQAVALCIFDLAKGYALRFGMDRFVLEAVNAGLEAAPASIYGMALKSDLYTVWFAEAHRRAGKPPLAEARARHPRLMAIYRQRNRLYDLIDATGYRAMSDEKYARWLHAPQSSSANH